MAMRMVHYLAKGHKGKLRIDVPEGKERFHERIRELMVFKR